MGLLLPSSSPPRPHNYLKKKEEMEREAGLQFLGFCGIIKESFHIIFAWRKILCKIAIALVFPLSAIYLADILFTELIVSRIYDNSNSLNDFPNMSERNSNVPGATYSQLALFWLFRFAFIVLALVFSSVPTSAVVYTVACFYTKKEIIFRKVLKAVLKVWTRVLVTFIWYFLFVFALNVVFVLLVFLLLWIISLGQIGIGIAALVVLLVLYLIAFVYLTIVWQLASVVSVLETVYGIKAVVKSKNLIKGKIIVSSAISIILGVFFFGIEVLFEILIAPRNSRNLGVRIPVGILLCLLLMKILLFGLVAQTVIYFVCKSYHQEAIDRSSLSVHLDAYLGNHVRSNPNAVQLEEIRVEERN